jgi:hypothetical protein
MTSLAVPSTVTTMVLFGKLYSIQLLIRFEKTCPILSLSHAPNPLLCRSEWSGPSRAIAAPPQVRRRADPCPSEPLRSEYRFRTPSGLRPEDHSKSEWRAASLRRHGTRASCLLSGDSRRFSVSPAIDAAAIGLRRSCPRTPRNKFLASLMILVYSATDSVMA